MIKYEALVLLITGSVFVAIPLARTYMKGWKRKKEAAPLPE